MASKVQAVTTSKTWLSPKLLMEMFEEAAEPRLEDCSILVRNSAVRSMKQGGKSMKARKNSRAYYNSALGRWVIAAAPGKPPHAQTKNLRNAIRVQQLGSVFLIGPTGRAWYGAVHEFGGRPFMRPALYREINKFPKLFKQLNLKDTRAARAIERALARMGGAA